MATTFTTSSLVHFSTTPIHNTHKPRLSYQPLISCLTLSKHKSLHFHNPNHNLTPFTRKHTNFKVSATSSEDTTAEIVSAATSADNGAYTVISVLLFIAFVALSILTIGVVYIGVTDFLQKREKERFEKEEAAKKKKSGKKVKVRARAGPRGFGQKINEEEDD